MANPGPGMAQVVGHEFPNDIMLLSRVAQVAHPFCKLCAFILRAPM